MGHPNYPQVSIDMAAIRNAALAAADAGSAVDVNLRLQGASLVFGQQRLDLDPSARVFLVALGKAAPAMAQAGASILGERLTAGLVTILQPPQDDDVSGRAEAARRPWHQGHDRLTFIPSGHPLPDTGSFAAGEAAERLMVDARPGDVLLALISGGGSAMAELPLPGISLQDLQSTNALLLRSGAPIEAVTAVRRSLSRIKGGGLARLAAPAVTIGLILSDVVGDRLSSIASGPTVLRRSEPQAARAVLESYGLWGRVPASVRSALARTGDGRRGGEGNRPRPPRPHNVLVGSNRQVVEAAALEAATMGFRVRVLTRQMRGEARQVGARLAALLLRAGRPACLLMGGETTVTVTGGGRGGRNQELALAAALGLEGVPHVAVMSLATDGIDGPTDAGGAVISGETAAQAHSLGLDPAAALALNDSYPLLNAVGSLLFTGPTGTNVGDLVVGLSYR
jgi:glycerate 2-kinase